MIMYSMYHKNIMQGVEVLLLLIQAASRLKKKKET